MSKKETLGGNDNFGLGGEKPARVRQVQKVLGAHKGFCTQAETAEVGQKLGGRPLVGDSSPFFCVGRHPVGLLGVQACRENSELVRRLLLIQKSRDKVAPGGVQSAYRA